MIRAAIFDVDGTLVDSVDLHALAWHEAFVHFGHDVAFDAARSQIGKGGDQLLPVFLSQQQRDQYGPDLEAWRSERFRELYLPQVKPFSAVPALLQTLRDAGVRIGVASSAKQEELQIYLSIAQVEHLVDVTVSADDAEHSKPAPDIFLAALEKLKLFGGQAVPIGDSPYDAQSSTRAGIRCVGLLSGAFAEQDLRHGGCAEVYPSPAGLLAVVHRSIVTTG